MGDGLMDIDLPHPAIVKPGPLWTGKQVFYVLLCPKRNGGWPVNLETKCRTFDRDQKDHRGVKFSAL